MKSIATYRKQIKDKKPMEIVEFLIQLSVEIDSKLSAHRVHRICPRKAEKVLNWIDGKIDKIKWKLTSEEKERLDVLFG